MKFIKLFVISLIIFISNFSYAKNDLPTYDSFVNISSISISQNESLEIKKFINQLKIKNNVDMAVLLVDSLENNTIEQYSLKIADYWKVGNKEKDNGIIFVISAKDHQARIEVGYGLEGKVTDLESKKILDSYAIPFFKQNNYFDGIKITIAKIGNITNEPKIALDKENPNFEIKFNNSGLNTKDGETNLTPEQIENIKEIVWACLIALLISVVVRIVVLKNSDNSFITGFLSSLFTTGTVFTSQLMISGINLTAILISVIFAFIVGLLGPYILLDFIVNIFQVLINIKGGSSRDSGGGFGGGGSSSKW